jgi:hypothetical protein
MKKSMIKKKCFTLTVGAKVFGPYLDSYRYRVAYMENKLGATFNTVWLTEGWKPWMKAKKERVVIDTTTPLLDGLDFIPVAKNI